MSSRTLKAVLAALLWAAVPVWGWAGQAPAAASSVQGEYVVRENANDCSSPEARSCSFCPAFVRNLNEFRALPFTACDSRLSEKYPEFGRPLWEEIPLDLDLAEKIVTNLFRDPADPGAGPRQWQVWLRAAAPLRAKGEITLWQTRIDIDGDGVPETILRLSSPLSLAYRHGEALWLTEPTPCVFRHGRFYLLDSPNAYTKQSFNAMALIIGDLIVRRVAGHADEYYALERTSDILGPNEKTLESPRRMSVMVLSTHGAGRVCQIHWTPASGRGP